MSLEERKWVMCVGGCRLHSPTLLFLTATEERERERESPGYERRM